MNNEGRIRAKQYLLRLISENDREYIRKTQDVFSIGKSTVYNYLREMTDNGLLIKDNGKITGFSLKRQEYSFTYDNDGHIREEIVFENDIMPLLDGLPKNVIAIWQYGFDEIMNNAIEHSQARKITCRVIRDSIETDIIIEDDGIGIFRNIQRYIEENTENRFTLRECASVLLAGKFTTAEKYHSGEGIFFTSHAMDKFEIYSDGVVFSRSNFSEKQNTINNTSNQTTVYMSLANRSPKALSEIFNRFSSLEEGFYRTQIPIAEMFPSGFPVSRSEARRLAEMMSKFNEIVLDFEGIENIGQGFTHELYVVWRNANPGKVIEAVNTSKNVEFMIGMVVRTAQKDGQLKT